MLATGNGKKGEGDDSSQASSGLSPLTPIDDAVMAGGSDVPGNRGEEGSDDVIAAIGKQRT